MNYAGARRWACLAFALGSCQSTAPPVAEAPAATPIRPGPQPVAQAPEPHPARFTFSGAMAQGGLVLGTAPIGTLSLTLDGTPVAMAADRRFMLGLDRDQPAQARLVAKLADGRVATEALRIAPRQWQIERVNVAQRPSGSSADYLRIRARELARIEAARAVKVTSEGWRQRFIWPAMGRISGVFGSQRVYRGTPGAYHSGVDVAAGTGAQVVTPADGEVVLAGPPIFSLEGNLVIIDHGMGLNSAFLHLSTVGVKQGQAVRQGQAIGTVGATGRATGPHLHWSMKWMDARIDPKSLVGATTE